MFQHFLLVLVQVELLVHAAVALDQLRGAEPGGNAQPVRVVLDQMDDGVDGAVHRRTGFAKVRDPGARLGAGHFLRAVDEFRHAFVLHGADGHHGNAQGRAELLHLHRAPVGPQLVHHVEGEDRGHLQLQELEGQVQVAFDIRRVDDIDDGVGLFLDDKVLRHDFFLRIRAQGIDTRQVDDVTAVLGAADHADFLVHRDPGEISHVLVGPRQGIEQRCFSTILVAG